MNFAWYDIIGTAGVSLIVAAYFLLQTERLRSTALSYSLMNGAGASLVVFSLLFNFNLSAFLVEAFWVLISILGIIRYWRHKSLE
jgi:hypothetical protein